MIPNKRLLAALAPLALLGLCVCKRDPAPPARPAGVVLEIDGLTIERREIEEWYPYLESIEPRLGHKTRIRAILANHVLPQRLAARAHWQRRAELRLKAEGLARLATNYTDLMALAQKSEEPEHRGYAPARPFAYSDLPYALARAVLDEQRLGQVQGPIETPQGFAVLSTKRIIKGTMTPENLAESYVVLFYTHDAKGFAEWLLPAQSSAAGRVTYVHPEFADALPDWIKP